jgi:heat shock protein HslJ
MKLITFLSAGIFIILAGMELKKPAKEQSSLYDTKWSLKKIHTDTGVQDVNTKAFIRFDKEKHSAGGNGSCNSFGSTAEIKGNEVHFSNIFSTKMYCEDVQKTENAFLGLLGKATRFEVKEKKLSLYNGQELLLEFFSDTI